MRTEDLTVALRAELLLLRVFAVAPLLFLGASLVIDFAHRGHFLPSVSAYYGSPVRDVFVGSLVAVGVVYVIYRGNTHVEDRALDLAGFFVVIVALVPYNYEALLAPGGIPDAAISRSTLIWVLVAWSVISLIFYMIQSWWRMRVEPPMGRRLKWFEMASTVPWLGFVVFASVWIAAGRPFDTLHFVSAVLVVSCLIVVVVSQAYRDNYHAMKITARRAVRTGYWCIAAVMFCGVIFGALLRALGNPWWILVTEIIEIVAFLAFWIMNFVLAGLALVRDLPASNSP